MRFSFKDAAYGLTLLCAAVLGYTRLKLFGAVAAFGHTWLILMGCSYLLSSFRKPNRRWLRDFIFGLVMLALGIPGLYIYIYLLPSGFKED